MDGNKMDGDKMGAPGIGGHKMDGDNKRQKNGPLGKKNSKNRNYREGIGICIGH